MAGRPRDNWSWPTPGGHGRARHPAPFEAADIRTGQRTWATRDQAQPRPLQASGGQVYRAPYPPGAQPNHWFRSLLGRFNGGQLANRVGGHALLNRTPGLPPKTVRPAFTGPYERKFARSCLLHNRMQYQPIEMLPAHKRPAPQGYRTTSPPRVRPALVGANRQRYSTVTEDDLMAQARARAGGRGRLGTRSA